jgi:hypothetical protein
MLCPEVDPLSQKGFQMSESYLRMSIKRETRLVRDQNLAITLLKSLGFEEAGLTYNKHLRLKLPRTRLHATICEKTVCVYRKESGDAYDWRRFKFGDLDALRAAINERIP